MEGARDVQEEGDAVGELGVAVAREDAGHDVADVR